MSRDWTPYENYLVEQEEIKRGHGDIFHVFENTYFVDKHGNRTALISEEEIALRKQFPQIGRLLMDGFPYLYKELSNIEGGLDFLRQKDNELAKLIESEGKDCDRGSYLAKWFYGELDEHFYHCETNNHLFVEKMINEAQRINFFNDVKKQFENGECDNGYGEPQAWIYLDNGRSIEITLEQEGLEEKDYFYSVRLNCNEKEFENNDYHSSNGVIDQYTTSGSSIEEVYDLISTALSCNKHYPVEEYNKSSLNDQIQSASDRAAESQTTFQMKAKEHEPEI